MKEEREEGSVCEMKEVKEEEGIEEMGEMVRGREIRGGGVGNGKELANKEKEEK